MDPQQRLLLEVTWEALENAGITPPMIRGTQTGIFVGMTTYDYTLTLAGPAAAGRGRPARPVRERVELRRRTAVVFPWRAHGPAVVLDTACSSSLVTVHLACQSLRRRESDQALVAAGST
jgi:acyl transferase domain-containing protein